MNARAQRRATGLLALVVAVSCQRPPRGEGSAEPVTSASSAPAPATLAPTFGKNAEAKVMPTDRPMLGVTAFTTIVFAEPKDTARRIGYLRLGARVPRSEEAHSKTKSCPGGWYEILPAGYVCVGKEATLDLDDPVLHAAEVRPNLSTPLPYRYGFVRAVLPLYLIVPTAEQQLKAEFKLKDHLDWYAANGEEVNKVKLGAWDVPVDERGVPIRGKALGELGEQKNSTELGLGQLFGGKSDADPIPSWLADGKRSIPNVSDFEVPEYATFADRARRFTGLAFVGSFATGEEHFNRRFGITTDLRLAPTSKVKPDSGSPWHGVEITEPSELPFAFVREDGATRYAISDGTATRGEELTHRSIVKLTGKLKKAAGERYLSTADGGFVRASDVGLVIAPRTWPKVAEEGGKWIEVSIGEQTLTMWEGKRPIYATLVSTGRQEYPTVTGEFRIRNKHITATMDSNESTSVGGTASYARRSSPSEGSGSAKDGDAKKPTPKSGGARGAGGEASPPSKNDDKKAPDKKGAPKKDTGKKDPQKGAPPKKDGGKKDSQKGAEAVIPKKGDGEYGVTKRRGEGTYALRDVPYIQYFESGFALHAAYWHDVFGKKRSHGCVNLSPIDAHRVFKWTEPAIPEGWHAVNSGEEHGEGTVVIVHE
jgi:lipoprotein-anchoring transpeptidase ErfK/SrfK